MERGVVQDCMSGADNSDAFRTTVARKPHHVDCVAPMILMTEVHYGADGKPVLLAINHHNSEVVQFTSMRWGMPL